MKKIYSTIKTVALVTVLYATSTMQVLADGGPTPYGGHNPAPTSFSFAGLAQSAIFVGFIIYVLGLFMIVNGKALKKKLA
ncbi:MAG: hypothetical protein Fur003_3340 [Candidatus Dojkabacteria bacterium]